MYTPWVTTKAWPAASPTPSPALPSMGAASGDAGVEVLSGSPRFQRSAPICWSIFSRNLLTRSFTLNRTQTCHDQRSSVFAAASRCVRIKVTGCGFQSSNAQHGLYREIMHRCYAHKAGRRSLTGSCALTSNPSLHICITRRCSRTELRQNLSKPESYGWSLKKWKISSQSVLPNSLRHKHHKAAEGLYSGSNGCRSLTAEDVVLCLIPLQAALQRKKTNIHKEANLQLASS